MIAYRKMLVPIAKPYNESAYKGGDIIPSLNDTQASILRHLMSSSLSSGA